MKKYLFISLFLVVQSILSASPRVSIQAFVGQWVTQSSGHILDVDVARKGLKVYDSFSNRWIKYRRKGNRSFTSNCGRVIEFLDFGTISFKRKGNRRKIIFNKNRLSSGRAHCGSNFNYSNTQDRYDYGVYDDRYLDIDTQVQGVYYNRALNHELIILEHRHGIKTKINGDSQWYYYSKNNNRLNSYTDRLGNTINANGLNTLIWNGVNGKRFSLEKLSNEIY